MTASPATSTTRMSRQIQAVVGQCRASHPAVTSFADSIATAMQMTDTEEPGNSTTMPRIENHAAAPARAIAAMYAPTSVPDAAAAGMVVEGVTAVWVTVGSERAVTVGSGFAGGGVTVLRRDGVLRFLAR